MQTTVENSVQTVEPETTSHPEPTPIAFLELSLPVRELYRLIVNLSKLKGFCWATQEYLGTKMDRTGRTVRTNLKVLQAAGFIKIERPGGYRSCRYTPLFDTGKIAGFPAPNTGRKLPDKAEENFRIKRKKDEYAPLYEINGIDEVESLIGNPPKTTQNEPQKTQEPNQTSTQFEQPNSQKQQIEVEPMAPASLVSGFKAAGVDFNKFYRFVDQNPAFAFALAAWLNQRAKEGDFQGDCPAKERETETRKEYVQEQNQPEVVVLDAAWLGRVWVNHRKGFKSEKEMLSAEDYFLEMLGMGIKADFLEKEIKDKERRKTEPIWDFQKRILAKPEIKANLAAAHTNSIYAEFLARGNQHGTK